MKQKTAVEKINKCGILLVFPVNNQKDPKSLWSELHPGTPMRWEWNDSGDDRVGKMWILMKKLSDSTTVVYSKWYQGRATFFSRELFTALVCISLPYFIDPQISRTAQNLLECLESDSPLSTKEIKKMTDLRGKENQKFYNRGMKELFEKFLIVAFGEVDDGAFPSLAVGATRNLYEDLFNEAREMKKDQAQNIIDRFMPDKSPFRKYYNKIYLP